MPAEFLLDTNVPAGTFDRRVPAKRDRARPLFAMILCAAVGAAQRTQAAEVATPRDPVEHVMAVLEALVFLREGRDAEAAAALERRLAVVAHALRQQEPTRERELILEQVASVLDAVPASDDEVPLEQIRAWSMLAVSMHPLTHAANVLVIPLANLREVVRGDRPRSSTPKVAQALEASLDHLLVAFDQGFLAGGYDAPPESVRDVVSLVAAYRTIFPSHRSESDWEEYREVIRLTTLWQAAERMHRDSALVDTLLASAAPPSERLLRRAPPSLRAALGERREGLTALWSALRGIGPPPRIELQTGAEDLILRLDVDAVAGRLRLYGDGRLVVTGLGPEPIETGQRLTVDERNRLVLGPIDGGLLAIDELEVWRANGAPGCLALSTARNSGSVVVEASSDGSRQRRQWFSVGVSVARVEEQGRRASLGPIERAAWFLPVRFVDPQCQPTEPVVRELQAGIAALLAVVDRIDGEQEPAPIASAVRREMPGLSIAFIDAHWGGVWITDGQRIGLIKKERLGPGLFASGDGRFIAYQRALGSQLMLFDRESAGPPVPLGPTDWSGFLVRWSPRSDALLLAGEMFRGGSRSIYVADAAGGSLRMLTSAANGWPASWSADGRLIYLQYSTTGGKGLRVLDLEGHVNQVEHPVFDSARDFVPSPDGRYLAYQAHEFDGAPATGLFTIPLDSATGLPSPGAEPTRVASGYPSFSWSPDSSSLIYSPGDGIHEVAVNGSDRRVLIEVPYGEYRDTAPQVSPDGRWLLFVRHSQDSYGGGYLYVARRDGSEPVKVGYVQMAVWVNGELGDVEEAEPPKAPNPRDRPRGM
jgi:hypothetical protein